MPNKDKLKWLVIAYAGNSYKKYDDITENKIR